MQWKSTPPGASAMAASTAATSSFRSSIWKYPQPTSSSSWGSFTPPDRGRWRQAKPGCPASSSGSFSISAGLRRSITVVIPRSSSQSRSAWESPAGLSPRSSRPHRVVFPPDAG